MTQQCYDYFWQDGWGAMRCDGQILRDLYCNLSELVLFRDDWLHLRTRSLDERYDRGVEIERTEESGWYGADDR